MYKTTARKPKVSQEKYQEINDIRQEFAKSKCETQCHIEEILQVLDQQDVDAEYSPKKSRKESQVHIADASKPTQIMRNISALTSPQPKQEVGMTNNHFSGFPQRSWGNNSS